eukprot:NODE_663_length_5420_cov_0.347679.p4 type:complete len:136 gc:universal NODE_663_length_5420_cov_0.347679:2471-2878(+)
MSSNHSFTVLIIMLCGTVTCPLPPKRMSLIPTVPFFTSSSPTIIAIGINSLSQISNWACIFGLGLKAVSASIFSFQSSANMLSRDSKQPLPIPTTKTFVCFVFGASSNIEHSLSTPIEKPTHGIFLPLKAPTSSS